jgi:hypothetical protein
MLRMRPQPFCLHGRHQRLGQKEGCAQVEIKRHVPAFRRYLVSRLAGVDAGCIDEDIRRPERLGSLTRNSANCVAIREVCGDDGRLPAGLGLPLLQLVATAGNAHHACPGFSERARNAPAQAR